MLRIWFPPSRDPPFVAPDEVLVRGIDMAAIVAAVGEAVMRFGAGGAVFGETVIPRRTRRQSLTELAHRLRAGDLGP